MKSFRVKKRGCLRGAEGKLKRRKAERHGKIREYADMLDRAFGPSGVSMGEAMATQNPIGRIGTPEIASAVLWLCPPGAAFTTGQDIFINGGYTAQQRDENALQSQGVGLTGLVLELPAWQDKNRWKRTFLEPNS